ncbi:type 1 glutamine amidotransferase [Treponema primitia]|uniref:type 1 glutamine amidotransferase n=1 Tax=Treponema primitia TaxID=88058 RepID=UPI0002554DBA|nr:type 1 glutamine amidotransferase [Treponema primitia]
MRIHYLQHVPFENPGYILTWAKNHRWVLTNTPLYEYPSGNVPFPLARDYDWLVIMGGPMNIYEDAEYPWLIEEKEFIKHAVDRGKVVIGLCLGAQLLAGVLGGTVTQNPQKEIGWFPVTLNPEARSLPLLSFLPEKPLVFQWHGDTFSTLPPKAVLLASSEACKHQAFMYRDRVFAFQFHLENTFEIISALVENCGNELVDGSWIQSAENLLGHAEYITQDNSWMDEFLTRLENQWRNNGTNTL